MLVAVDIAAVASAWAMALRPGHGFHGTRAGLFLAVAVVTCLALALLAGNQLYLARVCRLRSMELSRILRVSVFTGSAAYLAGTHFGLDLSAARAVGATAGMAALLAVLRGSYSSWLRQRRASGFHSRPVIIVGRQSDTDSIEQLVTAHPEMGFFPAAVVSRGGDVVAALEEHGSDTVVVATGSFSSAELNRLTRQLLDHGVHVHLSTGLSGIEQRRLRAQPLAREPMFYLEPLRISPWHQAAKRATDIAGSVVGLLVALPVMALAAAAIKLEDRGPVLFRSKRVGLNGEEFTILKLRTMVPNADRKLHLVASSNQRTGPLFKSHNDPRVTRVGRLLRATSLDELPQLFNVLGGTMSLVGPRPALAHEVAQFDVELRLRERVRPGITGLWQIEGRDDPSFDAYRRLDLFYVENWSLELDVAILLNTVRAVVTQAVRDLRRQWKTTTTAARPVTLDLTTPGELGS
ncbi:MAG TPA: sugar transferase [Acidimicrobiales bacterium]|nr:sugar transferase [Acidimicrobiales bacterium]